MRRRIVGRDAERDRVSRCLASDVPGTGAVVLTGPAGAGKTALWESALGEAAGTVLESRAGLAEAHLPWVCLTDLLTAVPSELIDALPSPQRHALRVVVLADDGDETVDERAIGMALWTLLDAMSRQTSLLIAIDDLQNVDPASATALSFALRRLQETAQIRIVATTRTAEPLWKPLDAIDPSRVTHLEVGPLSVAATFELLNDHLAVRLPRPMLLRVHETSGGNPLYALELTRALAQMDVVPAAGVPLPVPASLDRLIGERVRNQSAAVLAIVAGTAAAWHFTDAGIDREALTSATSAGLVVVEAAGGVRVIRATHPLIGATAYASLAAGERQALHERLAATSVDPVERARHIALAGTAPDEDVARTLDAGVSAALAAGTPEIAVELARLALERTDDDAARADRLDRLGEALGRAGDPEGAVAAIRAALDVTAPGPARALRLTRLVESIVADSGVDGVITILEAALDEAAGDPSVLAQVLVSLGSFTLDIDASMRYSTRANAVLAEVEDPDPRLLALTLHSAVGAKFRAGNGLDRETFERIIEIQRVHPMRRLFDRADAGFAALLKYADHLDEAEVRLLSLLQEAEASGDLESITYVLSHLPHIALWQGRLAEGQEIAERHLALSEQAGLAWTAVTARYNLGVALAYRGRLDEATRLLAGTIEVKMTDWDRQRAWGALGFVALSSGDAALAVEHLEVWHALLQEMHFREPGYCRSHLDYVEALVATNRLDPAEAFLDELDDQVRTSGRESAGAVAMTGRALILAARGDVETAADTIRRSLAYYETSPFRFDQARTRLIAGRIIWRSRARRAARDLVVAAVDDFTSFGATVWVDRARSELARMNFRATTATHLTETEQRIAELAAAGMTSKAIAGQLFLATKTVEANLARVYRKLGIRTAAELGTRISRPQ